MIASSADEDAYRYFVSLSLGKVVGLTWKYQYTLGKKRHSCSKSKEIVQAELCSLEVS